jgi:rubredoxin
MDSLKCSACGHEFDSEELYDLITYWGDAGWQDAECLNCGLAFQVEESVVRTFEVRTQLGEKPK